MLWHISSLHITLEMLKCCFRCEDIKNMDGPSPEPHLLVRGFAVEFLPKLRGQHFHTEHPDAVKFQKFAHKFSHHHRRTVIGDYLVKHLMVRLYKSANDYLTSQQHERGLHQNSLSNYFHIMQCIIKGLEKEQAAVPKTYKPLNERKRTHSIINLHHEDEDEAGDVIRHVKYKLDQKIQAFQNGSEHVEVLLASMLALEYGPTLFLFFFQSRIFSFPRGNTCTCV